MQPNSQQDLMNRIEMLEQQVRSFQNESEVDPQISRTIKLIVNAPSIDSTGGTSGTLRTVDEAGTSTYSVAAEFDGSITIEDAEGNKYKLGYYTP